MDSTENTITRSKESPWAPDWVAALHAYLLVIWNNRSSPHTTDANPTSFIGIYDCIGAATCSVTEIEAFVTHANNCHPAIEFSYEIATQNLPFLDILLSIDDDRIRTNIFYKPTDSHSYLQYNSSHPPACKNGIPYSQLLRLRRLCDSDADFKNNATTMASFFTDRGYPESVTNAAIRRTANMTKNEAMTPKPRTSVERVPLVLTYHPINTRVSKMIMRNVHILNADDTTSRIFPSPPLCAYRRDKNLRDTLVVANIIHQDEPPTPGSTTACGRPRCNTCKHVTSRDNIKGPSGEQKVSYEFTCTTKNLVYAIICTRCNMLYIGETKRRMADRFTEHLRSIRIQLPGIPVAQHFHNHDLNKDIKIAGLFKCHGSDKDRKEREQRLIHSLGTLHPNGINVSFNAFRV